MKICIVGGVAGGASAAARLRRLCENNQIILFEKDEHISFANCGLPYHISGKIRRKESLILWDKESFYARHNVEVRTFQEVVAIDCEKKELTVFDKSRDGTYQESYDKLILSPGAKNFIPPTAGLKEDQLFSLRNVADMEQIIDFIRVNNVTKALVVGGGPIGLEVGENLVEKGIAVTLVERAPQVMLPLDLEMANILHQELSKKLKLYLSTSVQTVRKIGECSECSDCSDGIKYKIKLSSGEEFECGIIIIAAGVRPEIGLAQKAGLAIGKTGGIIVDEHLRTSDPHIYAVGDAIEVKNFVTQEDNLIPLAGPANRQARIASDNIMMSQNKDIFTHPPTYRQTQGTSIVKVFALRAACTGINERTISKNKKYQYQSIFIHPLSHAGYYPGAEQMTLKILYLRGDGHDDVKILGAQCVGAEGVDKKIDIIAAIMRAGGKVYDFKDMEFCYAPPYNQAKDPINMLGFISDNIRNGLVRFIDPVKAQALANPLYLDVRTEEEVSLGKIPAALNIPLDSLRGRLPQEMPKDRTIVVYCKVGIRAYSACRILMENGYEKLYCLSGGYKTYLQFFPPPLELNSSSVISSENQSVQETFIELDLSGMQCPGPIVKLRAKLDQSANGERLKVIATDPGFARDIRAFCNSTGNTLLSLKQDNNIITAIVEKRMSDASNCATVHCATAPASSKKTIIIFSNDLDKALASFVIANGAKAMGSDVTMFFTFWGLNVLRRRDVSSTTG
ncbi:MAG: FAD-dependent oxidoreductase, partial [Oligoflexia bacterium]|nr:FAD-dependent oxidoreductase [Oligoflexia bacterium]